MKKLLLMFIMLLILALVSCNANNDFSTTLDEHGTKESIPSDPIDSDMPGEYFDGDTGETYPIDGEKPDNNGKEDKFTIPAGQITAAVRFDHDYYDYWLELLNTNQEGEGIFNKYTSQSFNTKNRLKLTIEGPLRAKLTLIEEQVETFTTYTDHAGVAYLFAKSERESYQVKVEYVLENNELFSEVFTVTNDQTLTLGTSKEIVDEIEIMFVIDTTGSMGDEISYLKAEMDDCIYKVKADNPNAKVSVALMFYRDLTDDYVTRYFDFTTNIEAARQNLAKQSAKGGGDFEEAVDIALTEALNKSWSNNNSTKILIHVADAPAHRKDNATWHDAVKGLAAKGVKIITIAASGIDKETEYYFRSQSLITSGAYVYITDDSGIGGSHIEPTIKEPATIEYLNKLLIRLINGFHTGDFKEAVYYQNDQQS